MQKHKLHTQPKVAVYACFDYQNEDVVQFVLLHLSWERDQKGAVSLTLSLEKPLLQRSQAYTSQLVHKIIDCLYDSQR